MQLDGMNLEVNKMKKLLFVIFLCLSSIILSQERGMKINAITQDGKSVPLYNASYALVVGVGDYTMGWPDLPNAVQDAREVKAALEATGFTVVLLENPTSAQLESAIKDFNATYGLDTDNRLLYYFAGHGHTIKKPYGSNVGYIVPADAPIPSVDQAGFNNKAISMESYNTWARNIDAKHVLYFFDSCFSGSIFALSRAIPEAITYKTSQFVRQFITAGSEDEQVPDRSIFKSQFIAGIKGEADSDKDGYVTGTELGMFLQDKVVNYSNGAQHPQYGKIRDPQLDKGDYVFVVPGAGAAQPVVQKPTGGDLDLSRYNTELEAATKAKEEWKKWQDNMEASFQKTKNLDQESDLSVESKVAMWQDFLKGFAENNPYSDQDEAYRAEAVLKKQKWENQRLPAADATAAVVSGNMVFVEGGTFQMGSNSGESDEKPVHSVTVSGFYMDKYEVTFDEYDAYCTATSRTKPGDQGWGRGTRPVINVSWFDAVAYCNWRSQKEGLTPCYTISGNNVKCNFRAKGYRLPTEAEWEYAARGGKESREYTYAGSNTVDDVGWYRDNSGSYTHPVGGKQANELGIYDMSGNVWEWCWDLYGSYSRGSATDPRGPSSGESRVLRGGEWAYADFDLRSANRGWNPPVSMDNHLGFRLSRTY